MKKYITGIIVLFVLSFKAPAQNVGYMGRHFIVHADYHGFFSLLKYNPRTESRPFGWNSRLAAGVEAAVGRRISLVADYNYFSRNFVYSSGAYPYPTGKAVVRGNGVELAVKFYYGDNIAPLGPWQRLGVAVHMLNGSFRSYDKNTVYARTDGPVILPVFTYGIGFQRIFKDRLVFNAGMQIGIPFTLVNFSEEFFGATFSDDYAVYTPNGSGPQYTSSSQHAYLKAQAAKHLFYNVNVGLGVLLF